MALTGSGSDEVGVVTAVSCAANHALSKGNGAHLIHGELHDEGHLVRKAGVMAVVLIGGDVAPGDPIPTEMPAPPHRPLEPV